MRASVTSPAGNSCGSRRRGRWSPARRSRAPPPSARRRQRDRRRIDRRDGVVPPLLPGRDHRPMTSQTASELTQLCPIRPRRPHIAWSMQARCPSRVPARAHPWDRWAPCGLVCARDSVLPRRVSRAVFQVGDGTVTPALGFLSPHSDGPPRSLMEPIRRRKSPAKRYPSQRYGAAHRALRTWRAAGCVRQVQAADRTGRGVAARPS